MLLRHSALYFLARGLPGLISLLAIIVYTRLLAPDEYGRYALVIAGVGLANKLLFEWLRLSLLRFLPTCADPAQRRALDATIAIAFLALAAAATVAGGLALLAVHEPALRRLLVAGLVLLWVQGLFDLELERARSQLRPLRYGLMAFGRAVLALALGAFLLVLGWGPLGLIVALIAGIVIAIGHPLLEELRALRPRLYDLALMRRLARYGGPLAVTAALGFVLTSTDRLLLGWLLGEAAAGIYAVGYDLASFSIGLLLMVVNLSAYPLALQALERHSAAAARQQLALNLTALLAVGLPATLGVVVLAQPLATVLLGASFQADAARLLPLVAVGALLRDLRAYYLDLAFQLGQRTTAQIWVGLSALLVDVVLVLWLAPRVGIVGAAYAMIVAYTIALVVSAVLGRRIFALPPPTADSLKVVGAAVVMGGTLWLLDPGSGPLALAGQVAAGALTYGAVLLLLDVGGARHYLLGRVARSRQHESG